MTDDGEPLRGKVIAVPESRQIEVLASLLERRGARVLRCPLVTILDADDERAVVAWLERMIDEPPELLVLYTGEGVERLAAFAARAGLDERFVATLRRTSTLTRGPKPKRALRALGISVTIEAPEPTTAGIVRALAPLPLDGRRIGVQLYAAEPLEALVEHCAARRIEADFVAPYRYAGEADEDDVVRLIERLASNAVDAIAFTSTVQVERLFAVAAARGLEAELGRGLAATRIAAVGPIVADALGARGVRVDAVPGDSFHLKPLVNALIAALAGKA
ncbi:MAG TPA: uroporphyrinogen-III synthase [Gammaproteobacteria bacterium]